MEANIAIGKPFILFANKFVYVLFSFPLATEMFHFARSSSLPYLFRQWCFDLQSKRVTPFGNPRVKGCLPPNRGLSQATTSFFVFDV